MVTTVEDCLPAHLRGPSTRITPMADGLSGARVYTVEAEGRSFVLKIASPHEDDADWVRAVQLQRLAAEAGLAPAVVHVDEARRAFVSAFVVDHSFMRYYLDPRTHEAALIELGQLIRRIHALPIPLGAVAIDRRQVLKHLSGELRTDCALPDFVGEAVERVLAEAPPPSDRAPVLGHNDVNPSNIVYDGKALLMLDWALARPADPFYDLAAISVFLRMDEETCSRLLSAYDGETATAIPARLSYTRRLVAAFVGTVQLCIARQLSHPGASGTETLATTLSLAEFVEKLLAGEVKFGTPDGQWAFGLALLKESLAL
jgi:aminoglycoside phosphotransferase (APT) family kinase protein